MTRWMLSTAALALMVGLTPAMDDEKNSRPDSLSSRSPRFRLRLGILLTLRQISGRGDSDAVSRRH